MGIFGRFFEGNKGSKSSQEKSDYEVKREFVKQHKIEALNYANLSLEELKNIVRLKEEIEHLSPAKMKALEEQVKELAKKKGSKLSRALKYLGTIMTGAGALAASVSNPFFAALGFSVGGASFVSAAVEGLKKNKQEKDTAEALKGAFLHLTNKYGEGVARAVLEGYERVKNDPTVTRREIIAHIVSHLDPENTKSYQELKYSNDPNYLKALLIYKDFDSIFYGDSNQDSFIDPEVRAAREKLEEQEESKSENANEEKEG